MKRKHIKRYTMRSIMNELKKHMDEDFYNHNYWTLFKMCDNYTSNLHLAWERRNYGLSYTCEVIYHTTAFILAYYELFKKTDQEDTFWDFWLNHRIDILL